MSLKPSPGGIGDEDRRVFRLIKILASEGRHALHCVFKWGCKKKSTESIGDYLKNEKKMTNKDYKNRFDTMMQKTIDKDPSGESYDVSLIFACIKWGCNQLAEANVEWQEGQENLESLCTKVKNMRNRLFHGEEVPNDDVMNEKCRDITEVLENVVKKAGSRYGVSDGEVKSSLKKINTQVCHIMTARLGEEDINELLKFREERKKSILKIGREELSQQYKDTSKIDPASFVTGKERLDVENVFTKLEVICENMDETHEVGYKELLEVKTELEEKPTVIIVEGDAGAGKTTLTKLILSDWAKGSTIFTGLERYDLVFWAEGKKRISSYLGLIQGLLPTASYKFDDADLVRSVLQLEVLLVMDGFDELNTESEKLIKELLHKQVPSSKGHLQLLITTRPSKLSDLCNVLGAHTKKIQTKLRGISLEKRVEFVSKLHNEMIKEKQSYQDTQKLVDLLKQSQARLGEHYRLPLNLTLLTYLWASDPTKVNPETTSTGLYIAFLELIESRLQARLQERLGCVALPEGRSQEVVREFQKDLYRVCMDTLLSDSMQLSTESKDVLEKKCEDLEVPFNEMIEAFLVVEKEWTSSGYITELTVPHKSILEFYAANQFMTYINNKLKNEEQEKKIKSLLMNRGITKAEIDDILQRSESEDIKSLKKICNDLLKTDQNLAKYDNMLLHLTGLLTHQCPDMLHRYAEDLVDILKEAEFKGTKWLDILVEAKCDDTLATLLAPLNDLQLIVRDGHMGAALALFKYLDTNIPVQVILENEVTYIPRLDDMLCQLSQRDCAVQIFFKHQWKNKECGSSDEYLGKLQPEGCSSYGCSVTKFTGHLGTLSCLPETTTELKIAFANTEHAKQLLVELNDLVNKRSDITYIGIHVMSEVRPDDLTPLRVLKPLQGRETGSLWLSGVDKDWEMKCGVIRALLPAEGMFNSIMFPQCNFTAKRCTDILKCLKELGVKVNKKGGIRFFSTFEKNELLDLKEFARQSLGCALYCSDESSVW
ncbi:uncharacterized protein LOC127008578 isoform X2 [Eriocheir sinensis]|uniref:uncharacterized protein LOC127008578 isoform X2 n=1 Tax=Eriocheir sinensis TaxID=95602 RepID=UPI0021C910D8|nr:uncharacterized protein LOC127008578 isoform X2 [Eriocheir sinensis]